MDWYDFVNKEKQDALANYAVSRFSYKHGGSFFHEASLDNPVVESLFGEYVFSAISLGLLLYDNLPLLDEELMRPLLERRDQMVRPFPPKPPKPKNISGIPSSLGHITRESIVASGADKKTFTRLPKAKVNDSRRTRMRQPCCITSSV